MEFFVCLGFFVGGGNQNFLVYYNLLGIGIFLFLVKIISLGMLDCFFF